MNLTPTATVLVVGPRLAGVGGVAAVLRAALTGCWVVEPGDEPPGRPADVVVFVTSAAAPISRCEAELLDEAAAGTDAVVAVVAKIDAHRCWPEVLAANRTALHRHAARYRFTPWVGVAAKPQIGPVVTGALLDAVDTALHDGSRNRRNRLRAEEAALSRRIGEEQRIRQAQAVRGVELRAWARRTRLELAGQTRAQVVALRVDLQREAMALSRRAAAAFGDLVHHRVQRTVEEFDDALGRWVAEVLDGTGAEVLAPTPRGVSLWEGLPGLEPPAEDALARVFAAIFGLGAALTLGRLVCEAVPAAAPSGPAVGLAVGLAGLVLAVWVVRTRRLAAARTAAHRWVAEVSASLRAVLEERLLIAESALLAALTTGRQHNAAAGADASGVRGLIAQLAQVRAELAEGAGPVQADGAGPVPAAQSRETPASG